MSASLSSSRSVDIEASRLDYAPHHDSERLPLIVTFPFIAATSAGLWYLIYKAVCGAVRLIG